MDAKQMNFNAEIHNEREIKREYYRIHSPLNQEQARELENVRTQRKEKNRTNHPKSPPKPHLSGTSDRNTPTQ
jgi:hypothetical protein